MLLSEVIATTTYLTNINSLRANQRTSLIEQYIDNPINLSKFKVFGCIANTLIKK